MFHDGAKVQKIIRIHNSDTEKKHKIQKKVAFSCICQFFFVSLHRISCAGVNVRAFCA